MWVPVTEQSILSKLSSPELAALRTAATAPGQGDPLAEVIAQVVREVRGHVAACKANRLGPAGTIPDELLGAAVNRVRYELATRLPVASLLTDPRIAANDQANTLLRDTAACRFSLEPPDTPSPEKQATVSPLWFARRKKYTSRHEDGA
ncbi:MAG: DUF1320 family protein [Bifidobacteriaceae bacterium]|jgi:hypothetical protein|nr:DUF1320 family protein [Bifidobacteriaceae bacterium]